MNIVQIVDNFKEIVREAEQQRDSHEMTPEFWAVLSQLGNNEYLRAVKGLEKYLDGKQGPILVSYHKKEGHLEGHPTEHFPRQRPHVVWESEGYTLIGAFNRLVVVPESDLPKKRDKKDDYRIGSKLFPKKPVPRVRGKYLSDKGVPGIKLLPETNVVEILGKCITEGEYLIQSKDGTGAVVLIPTETEYDVFHNLKEKDGIYQCQIPDPFYPQVSKRVERLRFITGEERVLQYLKDRETAKRQNLEAELKEAKMVLTGMGPATVESIEKKLASEEYKQRPQMILDTIMAK